MITIHAIVIYSSSVVADMRIRWYITGLHYLPLHHPHAHTYPYILINSASISPPLPPYHHRVLVKMVLYFLLLKISNKQKIRAQNVVFLPLSHGYMSHGQMQYSQCYWVISQSPWKVKVKHWICSWYKSQLKRDNLTIFHIGPSFTFPKSKVKLQHSIAG